MTGNEGVYILFRVNFLRDPFSNHYLRFTLRGKTTSVFFLNPYSKLTSKTLQSSSPPTDRYSKSASRASLSLDQTGKKDLLYPPVRVRLRPSVTDGMDRRTARRRRAASRSPSPCPCPTAIERANGSVGRSVGRSVGLSPSPPPPRPPWPSACPSVRPAFYAGVSLLVSRSARGLRRQARGTGRELGRSAARSQRGRCCWGERAGPRARWAGPACRSGPPSSCSRPATANA